MLLPARGVAAFRTAIRFASAPIIRCRSTHLVEVRSNSRLPPVSTMRRALAMPHSARSPPPSKRHTRLTVEGAVAIGNDSQGFMAKPCTPHPHCAARAALRATNCQCAGSRGKAPRPFLLGGCKGGCSLSEEREHPPLSHPHMVWGNHNLVICTPAVFSINFLVPTVSNATSSSASPPIGVTEMTSPSPNVLWWIWSPEES